MFHPGMARQDLVCVVFRVLAENAHPLVLAAASQHVAKGRFSPENVRQAQRILISRIAKRKTSIEADIASESLAGAFLLAAIEGGSKPALVAALDEVQADDPPILVRRVSKLAGLAWLWRQSADLTDILNRLASSDDAGEQALYELAVIALDNALSQPTEVMLRCGLHKAADLFGAAVCADPDLTEAVAFFHAVHAIIQFCESEPPSIIESSILAAQSAASERALELDNISLRDWLRPSVDAEIAWCELSNCLQGISERLEERSWLRAVPVLQQLGRLRRALIAVAGPPGDVLRAAVTSRIADGLVAKDGLRAHVRSWAKDSNSNDEDREHARALLRAIEAADHRTPGKAEGLVGDEAPSNPDNAQPQELVELMRLMEVRDFSSLTGKTEETFLALHTGLKHHSDYKGSVRRDTLILTSYLLLYAVNCLDATSTMADVAFGFLRDSNTTKPLEIELQKSLWTFLRLQIHGFPPHQVIREVPDIASGRADISIIRPDWQLVLELKRELKDASREGIRKYLGQAAAYQLTGPRIGFLVVLDLCSQRDWRLTLEDNCWVERVASQADSHPRIIVVLRIAGSRRLPSETRTPGHPRLTSGAK